MAGGTYIRTVGIGRLFTALSSLVEAAEAESDWWVGTVVTYSCVPGRTRVLTDEGTKKISAIEPGDRVLTQAGVFKPVRTVHRADFREGTRMVRLVSRWRRGAAHELELTANHKVMVSRGGKNQWVEAGDLRPTDRVFHRRKTGWLAGTAEVRTCKHCGVRYTSSQTDEYATSQGKMFCSPSCRGAYWAAHPRENPHYGATRSVEARRKMSRAARRRLDENPQLHPSRIVAQRGHETSCESQVASFLGEMGVPYEAQVQIGRHVVDFLCPTLKRIVEADGAFWHQDQAADTERDRALLEELGDGWSIVHIHFVDPRFSPTLDRRPMDRVAYVPVNPGPATYVDPDEFEATDLLEIERYEWTRESKRAPKTRPLYDLEVDGIASYYANGFLVHNSFLEFGTRKMRARPFFQPAILRVARRWGQKHPVSARTIGNRTSGRSLWALMVGDERGLVARLAFALEREVKQTIREKGLIDTGNLRGSIVAAPTLPRMKEESLRTIPLFTQPTSGRGQLIDRASITDTES